MASLRMKTTNDAKSKMMTNLQRNLNKTKLMLNWTHGIKKNGCERLGRFSAKALAYSTATGNNVYSS
jgi:hypothetical protein